MKYRVQIEEKRIKTIEVEGYSYSEVYDSVKNAYEKNELTLGKEDIEYSRIHVHYPVPSVFKD